MNLCNNVVFFSYFFSKILFVFDINFVVNFYIFCNYKVCFIWDVSFVLKYSIIKR